MTEKPERAPPNIDIFAPGGACPRGRPTTYDPEYCDVVLGLGAKGKSRAQIAANLGHSRQTIAAWEEQHPDFLSAMKRANDLCLAWWEEAGQQGMFMMGFSASAYSLQIRNRFPADYRDAKVVQGDKDNPLHVVTGAADEFTRRVAGLAARSGASSDAGEPGRSNEG